MSLLHTLKQIQKVKPDADYTRRSRLAIVGQEAPARVGIFEVLFQSFQFGSTLAAAVLFIVVLAGGFSIISHLSPLSKLSSLDITAIRAEAEAVDIQIQLTDLNYAEPTTADSQTTVPSPAAIRKITESKDLNTKKPTTASSSTSTATTTPETAPTSSEETVSIEDALDFLSQ